MSGSDKDAVQAYLNELLTEPLPVEHQEPPAVKPHRPQQSEERVLAASPPEISLQEHLQEQVHSLEQVKRQQLQALLDRRMAVTAPAVSSASDELLEGDSVFSSPQPTPVVPIETAPRPSTSPLLQWCENGRPVWAQGRFEVLLFQVAGLTLAVPLIALGQIYPLNDSLARIFGQADWFMGLLPTPAGHIRTVNTALFVMPERYEPAFAQGARYVISIDGLDWGLAVDKVQQPTRLLPDDVTWRTDRSKRPWLAGTVKTAMCALLDIPRMGEILQDQDRKRRAATTL